TKNASIRRIFAPPFGVHYTSAGFFRQRLLLQKRVLRAAMTLCRPERPRGNGKNTCIIAVFRAFVDSKTTLFQHSPSGMRESLRRTASTGAAGRDHHEKEKDGALRGGAFAGGGAGCRGHVAAAARL